MTLTTSYGLEQFKLIQNIGKSYEDSDNMYQFKKQCAIDLKKMTDYQKYFLENHNMMKKYKMDDDDKEGWIIFNEMSDVISCLSYFSDLKK